MIYGELELAYKENIDNDDCEFVRRLFEGLSTRFPAYLIIDLINLLPRLSAKEDSPRDRLYALEWAWKKADEVSRVSSDTKVRGIKNNDVYSNGVKE